ncbi:MAG: DHHW family protein [Selenomonadaceae bacterium]
MTFISLSHFNNKTTIKDKMMIFCACLLIMSFLIVMLRSITMNVIVKKLHIYNPLTKAILYDSDELRELGGAITDSGKNEIHIDWAKLYPFEYSATENKTKSNKSTSTEVQKFNEFVTHCHSTKNRITGIEKKIGDWTNIYFWNYMVSVKCYNLYKKTICWDISRTKEYNSVVVMPDGQLVSFNPRVDTSWKINAVKSLSDKCHESGINFLMVLAPSKIARSETDYAGKLDFSNQNGDEFVTGLREYGVDVIDIRDEIETAGFEQHQLFYKTDHHWTASTARWASSKILDYMNNHYGYDADISLLDPIRYDKTTYPSNFLGSRGKKVTLAMTTKDDFSLYYPKFQTAIHISIPSLSVSKDGDFSVVYDMSRLNNLSYWTYSYGDNALTSMENRLKADGKKALIVKDSFALTAMPFLILGMEKIQGIDLRYFTGSLLSYIKSEQPDTVIVLYNIENLTAENKNNSHTAFFDFR